MDGPRLLFALVPHLVFVVIGIVATLNVFQRPLRRAAAGCSAVLLALGTQGVVLFSVGALAYSEGLDLRNMALLALVAGAIAGSMWLMLRVDHARAAILRGGGELSARVAALWIDRLALPIALAGTGAVAISRSAGPGRLVAPAAVFATLLLAIALVTAALLRRASRYIARR
jgi:hypothetical protein